MSVRVYVMKVFPTSCVIALIISISSLCGEAVAGPPVRKTLAIPTQNIVRNQTNTIMPGTPFSFNMPVIKPRKDIDYTILVQRPRSDINYTILDLWPKLKKAPQYFPHFRKRLFPKSFEDIVPKPSPLRHRLFPHINLSPPRLSPYSPDKN